MKKVLYLGLNSKNFSYDLKTTTLISYPIIKTIPRKKEDLLSFIKEFKTYTDLIFTSQTSVTIFFKILKEFVVDFDQEIQKKNYFAVGKVTASSLKIQGIQKVLTPQNETAEGLVDLLNTKSFDKSFIFWPHSALSRSVLLDFFFKKNLKFEAPIFYDTVPCLPNKKINLNEMDEIIFTSPSTVDAFFQFFPIFPEHLKFTSIGEVTESALIKVVPNNPKMTYR